MGACFGDAFWEDALSRAARLESLMDIMKLPQAATTK